MDTYTQLSESFESYASGVHVATLLNSTPPWISHSSFTPSSVYTSIPSITNSTAYAGGQSLTSKQDGFHIASNLPLSPGGSVYGRYIISFAVMCDDCTKPWKVGLSTSYSNAEFTSRFLGSTPEVPPIPIHINQLNGDVYVTYGVNSVLLPAGASNGVWSTFSIEIDYAAGKARAKIDGSAWTAYVAGDATSRPGALVFYRDRTVAAGGAATNIYFDDVSVVEHFDEYRLDEHFDTISVGEKIHGINGWQDVWDSLDTVTYPDDAAVQARVISDYSNSFPNSVHLQWGYESVFRPISIRSTESVRVAFKIYMKNTNPYEAAGLFIGLGRGTHAEFDDDVDESSFPVYGLKFRLGQVELIRTSYSSSSGFVASSSTLLVSMSVDTWYTFEIDVDRVNRRVRGRVDGGSWSGYLYGPTGIMGDDGYKPESRDVNAFVLMGGGIEGAVEAYTESFRLDDVSVASIETELLSGGGVATLAIGRIGW